MSSSGERESSRQITYDLFALELFVYGLHVVLSDP